MEPGPSNLPGSAQQDQQELRNSISVGRSSTSHEDPLRKIKRQTRKRKRRKLLSSSAVEGHGHYKRMQRFRKKVLTDWGSKSKSSIAGDGLGPTPTMLVCPTDITTARRMLKKQWVPTNMDFLDEECEDLPGIPEGLEFLALSDHLYVQHVPVGDFPDAISRQISPFVPNRYQIICGDTRNRIYYAIAKYPVLSGLLRGYRPFRLFLMTGNLDIVLHIQKNVSCLLFWCFGGYGTRVKVKGPNDEFYGELVQRWSFLRPHFDLLDEKKRRIMVIKGPPVVLLPFSFLSYLPKFQLYQVNAKGHSKPKKIGIFLESAYGVGNRNMKNSLRVGFPRNLPLSQKAVVLASLFLLFITYYELGDEYPGTFHFRQQLRPLLRMNPLHAVKLTRPYGYIKGKFKPITMLLTVIIFFYLLNYLEHISWSISLHNGTTK